MLTEANQNATLANWIAVQIYEIGILTGVLFRLTKVIFRLTGDHFSLVQFLSLGTNTTKHAAIFDDIFWYIFITTHEVLTQTSYFSIVASAQHCEKNGREWWSVWRVFCFSIDICML